MNRMTDRRLLVVLVALSSSVPAASNAQSAKGLLDKVLDTETKRSKGVSDYAMDITMMNHETTLYYERVSVVNPEGKPIETFRLVPFDELKRRQQAGQGMSPEAWQAYSDALNQTGSALSAETERGMNQAGLPAGMLSADSQAEPWASPNPATMMHTMAGFANAAGDAERESDANANEDTIAKSMLAFRKHARIVGKEAIGKTSAIHVRAEGLKVVEEVGGERLTIHAISLWIDAQKLVPLKMRMDGVATQDEKSRKVFMERLDQDYRIVPDSKLYMPYRSVVHMAGLFGPNERKQLEDARKQLEELDQKLASMPPEERARMERMVGPQIRMMRSMVDGGEMEVVTKVRAIRVNTGLSGAFVTAPSSKAIASTAAPTSADFLVQSIQRDLMVLGYDPGNTDGELSTATVVAISKFQAENDLEVTGEVTPQLAGILAAKRDAAVSASATAGREAQSLEDAQAECLQQKIETAKRKKRAIGKALRATGNIVSRYGGVKVTREVEKASQEAYKADATAKDLEEAANALGLSTEDVESCRNPK